jgi:hypothetical protein
VSTESDASRSAAPAVADSAGPTVDELLADGIAPSAVAAPACVVACVLDDRHPSIVGRVEVSWRDDAGRGRRAWVPSLHGLSVRRGDRVLLMKPEGLDEPVVTGVLDGFARREAATVEGARIELRPDEVVRVCDHTGRALIELRATDTGPLVRLLTDDTDVEVAGKLRLRAKSLELEAIAGPVKVKASDDVIVTGEIINLN